MTDDDRAFQSFDPACLLPRTIELQPENPDAEKLPRQYVGTDEQVYGGTSLF